MKYYLPVTVRDVPADQVFDGTGRLLPNVEHYVRLKVVRVIAGPEHCDLIIDIKRPYERPPQRNNYDN